jgi:hypothetical protein
VSGGSLCAIIYRGCSSTIVRAAAFFTELATNASAHNVSIIIYSGNVRLLHLVFHFYVLIQCRMMR